MKKIYNLEVDKIELVDINDAEKSPNEKNKQNTINFVGTIKGVNMNREDAFRSKMTITVYYMITRRGIRNPLAGLAHNDPVSEQINKLPFEISVGSRSANKQ